MKTYISPVNAKGASLSELERNVYCVLGLPIDALDMQTTLRRIDAAAAGRTPFLISTPNLNFLVNARSDPKFRQSILESDLCPADGAPVIWIACLIGAPIKYRVSGSDIFNALKTRKERALQVFFFGGGENVAASAAKAINSGPAGVRCVGTLYPGFGTVEDMSQDHTLNKINASGADFLVVSLGAKKGQLWLHRNHARLTIPVRAHFGAVVNFEAGTVNRAPAGWRRLGLEWLWRIKEEPQLWRRYGHDGTVFLRLLCTHVLPLAIGNRAHWITSQLRVTGLKIKFKKNDLSITIALIGDAVEQNITPAIDALQKTLRRKVKGICIDLSQVRFIDQRFIGLLMMLRKETIRQDAQLTFLGVSSRMRRMFRLNGAEYLLG